MLVIITIYIYISRLVISINICSWQCKDYNYSFYYHKNVCGYYNLTIIHSLNQLYIFLTPRINHKPIKITNKSATAVIVINTKILTTAVAFVGNFD